MKVESQANGGSGPYGPKVRYEGRESRHDRKAENDVIQEGKSEVWKDKMVVAGIN